MMALDWAVSRAGGWVRPRSAPGSRSPASSRGCAATWCRRAFWAFMLVAHGPGWLAALGAGSTDIDPLRWLALSASQAFFVLKLVDVRWLRLPRSRRAWLIVTVAIALLHADVARRMVIDEASPAAAPVAAWVSAVVTLLTLQWPRVRDAVRPRVLQRRARVLVQQALDAIAALALVLRRCTAVLACPVNRAPPTSPV